MAKELTKFEKEMQDVLLKERERLIKRIEENEKGDSISISDATSSEDGDMLSQSLEAIKESSLRAHDANSLKAVEHALGRLSAGTYGKCMKCGKKITQERLRAIPQAMLCIDCKNEMEQKDARLKALKESERSAESERDNSLDNSEDKEDETDD